MLTKIVLAAALILTGCAHSTPSAVQVKPPHVPAQLLVECPPLRPLMTGLLPELAAASARDSLQYNDCKARHKALADAVRAREGDLDAR